MRRAARCCNVDEDDSGDIVVDWYLLPLAAVIDALYVAWMWAAESKRPHLGGLTSMGIWGMTLWGVVEVTENPWNIGPVLIGAYLGSYLTICWKKTILSSTLISRDHE
jgi:hypothetical protein